MSNFINRITTPEEQTFDEVEQAIKDKINNYADVTKQHMDIYRERDKNIYNSLENIYNTLKDTNICCSDKEKDFLLNLAIKIEEVFRGMPFTFKDICIAVIYTYYGMNLIEDDYFNISILRRNHENKIMINQNNWSLNKEFNYWINTYADNISVVYYLYLRLGAPSTIQEEFRPIKSTDGEDLSEKLRKFVINEKGIKRQAEEELQTSPLKKQGGTKKSKKRRSKKTKSKKSKRRITRKS